VPLAKSDSPVRRPVTAVRSLPEQPVGQASTTSCQGRTHSQQLTAPQGPSYGTPIRPCATPLGAQGPRLGKHLLERQPVTTHGDSPYVLSGTARVREAGPRAGTDMTIDFWRLDEAGVPEPCGPSEWMEACIARTASIEATDHDPFRVAFDEIGDASVSTVFLMSAGSHPLGIDSTPALFETMVFPVDAEGGALIWRSASRSEAMSRHDRAAEMLRRAAHNES